MGLRAVPPPPEFEPVAAMREAIEAIRLSERIRSTLPLLGAVKDIIAGLAEEDPELAPELMAYLSALGAACEAGGRSVDFICARMAARTGVTWE